MPAFPDLCERVAALWKEKRTEIAAQDAEVVKALSCTLPEPTTRPVALSGDVVAAMITNLRANFDPQFGGFGRAPKFPHPTDLELCLRRGEREIALTTLTRMCEGGIFDQLGGGFCRYSVDAQWQIPHFEKMLYDNGPLLGLLADAWLVRRVPLFERCAAETAGWMMRELQSPEGGYYSSLDADSEGEEGKFYVWDRDEVRQLLSSHEYAATAAHFGLDQPPNFENRHWHLRIARPAHLPIETAKQKLFEMREKRIRPGRDEKILVSWNALAVRGMAHAGRVFACGDWIASARRAFEFLREKLWRGDRLLATYKDGRAHLNAYLDDYAFLIAAALELLQARFSSDDLAFACRLADTLLAQFEDAERGGFFFTGRDHERLILRPKPGQDNATPSGNAIAALVLERLAALTGETRYSKAARRTLELFYPVMLDAPAGFAAMALALEEQLEPPATLILRGSETALGAWQSDLARQYLPATLLLAIPDGAAGLPSILDKPARPGGVNGWVCRGVTCLEPIAELATLTRTLKEKG
jgi:uncharacterized protein YyaL (SSP411 family)